jgi:hypothetical protein
MSEENKNQTEDKNAENEQKWSQLAKRATTDEKLKQQLLTDPAPALRAEGIYLPERSRVRVAEENGRLDCVVETSVRASAAAAGELTGSDMNNIVGGGAVSFTYSKIEWTYTQQKRAD